MRPVQIGKGMGQFPAMDHPKKLPQLTARRIGAVASLAIDLTAEDLVT